MTHVIWLLAQKLTRDSWRDPIRIQEIVVLFHPSRNQCKTKRIQCMVSNKNNHMDHYWSQRTKVSQNWQHFGLMQAELLLRNFQDWNHLLQGSIATFGAIFTSYDLRLAGQLRSRFGFSHWSQLLSWVYFQSNW